VTVRGLAALDCQSRLPCRHPRVEKTVSTFVHKCSGRGPTVVLPTRSRREQDARATIELGPTGAWFAVTTRAIYNEVGGFIFRPYKPYQLHDGKYIRKLAPKGYFAGILRKSVVYHATGPYWAAAYGYKQMWNVKYRRNYKSLLPLIDDVKIDEVPSAQYARAMAIKVQQSYGGA
jgi:hypothetical protein